MAKKKDSAGQSRIDFSRGEELAMLVNLPLKKVYVIDGAGRKKLVKPRDLYDALRAIDDHGGHGCWPSVKRLCAVSRMSRSAMIRAICALVNLGFVVAERRPYRSNRYVIQWTVVRARCERDGVVPAGNSPSSPWEPPRCPAGTVTVQEPTNEPPPPAPKKKANPRKEVEVELVKTGIGNAKECCRAMRERGLNADESLAAIRDGQATIAKLSAMRKLKNPIGALHWFLTRGFWPFDVTPKPAAEQDSHKDHDKKYWPIISAMSHEEQAALMPDNGWRNDLGRFGPENPQNRYMLVACYAEVQRREQRLAVATA